MLFFSNSILTLYAFLLVLMISSFTITNRYLTMYASAFTTLKFATVYSRLLAFCSNNFFVWAPLFKRSSYIGLVWKSNWKL